MRERDVRSDKGSPFGSPPVVIVEKVTTENSVWSGSAEVFQAASTFIGARPGWVFKLGTNGLGYYEDIRDSEIESDLYKDSTDSVARLATLKLAWRGRFDRLPQVLARSPHLWNAAFEDGTTLLHLACYKGDMSFLNLAITEGHLAVDVLGKNRRTPLMWAAGFGHISAARLLLNSKADPQLRDETGATAFVVAAQNVENTAMLFLLAQSDNRDSVLAESDLNGCSAIHWAALRGDLEGLKLLSRFRADLQQVDGLQNTVLHYAVQAEKTPKGALHSGKQMLVWLLQQGVDPAQENSQGQTCMDIAKDRYPRVLTELEAALKTFTAGRSKQKQTKKDDYTPLDLEKGFEDVNEDVVFKEWGVYFPMVVWVGCVSFTVVEYILDVRQLAWGSLWLRWGALAFELCVLVSLVLFFYIACVCDPGRVPLKEYGTGPETYLRALRSGQEIPAKRLCTTSWVLKDLRTKYCKLSGACIQEFDHFCDFTVCPIGKGNHRTFIVLHCIEPAAQCWYLFLCAMIVWQTRGRPATVWDCPQWAWDNAWEYPLMVIATGINAGSLIYVFYMLAAQAYMIANNSLMNEMANFERYEHLWKDSATPELARIFDKGDPIRNVLDFWWFRTRSEIGPRCRAEVREMAAALKDAGAK